MKVHDLQTDPEIPVVGPQEDPQSEVPKDEVHPQYTPSLRRSDRVCQAPLRYNFIIENDNLINIIQDDDPLMLPSYATQEEGVNWIFEKFKLNLQL